MAAVVCMAIHRRESRPFLKEAVVGDSGFASRRGLPCVLFFSPLYVLVRFIFDVRLSSTESYACTATHKKDHA
jgi:hypothetical protein